MAKWLGCCTSGVSKFKLCSDSAHWIWFNSRASLVHSWLVCLQPVGILICWLSSSWLPWCCFCGVLANYLSLQKVHFCCKCDIILLKYSTRITTHRFQHVQWYKVLGKNEILEWHKLQPFPSKQNHDHYWHIIRLLLTYFEIYVRWCYQDRKSVV